MAGRVATVTAWGDVEFNSKTGEYFRANIQFPFFEHYLKGKGAAQPKAMVFETGTNVWRSFDTWPPKAATAKTLYFHSDGRLSFDPPDEAKGADEYTSDPNHPVPFVGYTTTPSRSVTWSTISASPVTAPTWWSTRPIRWKRTVTIAAPHLAKAQDCQFRHRLPISSSNLLTSIPKITPVRTTTRTPTSAFWIRRRCTWGGYQELLRGEPFRAKFRNNWEKPEPLTPGKEADLNFTMPDPLHTFRRGHRIMVQMQSSWFPLTDRNPQTFTDIPNARPEGISEGHRANLPPERRGLRRKSAGTSETMIPPIERQSRSIGLSLTRWKRHFRNGGCRPPLHRAGPAFA